MKETTWRNAYFENHILPSFWAVGKSFVFGPAALLEAQASGLRSTIPSNLFEINASPQPLNGKTPHLALPSDRSLDSWAL